MLFGFTSGWSKETEYSIRGTIFSEDGHPAAGVTVELKKIFMSETPSIENYKISVSDPEGRFGFKIQKIEKRVFYRIDVKSKNITIGSNPIKFKEGQTEIVVNFELPGVSNRLDALKVLKNIFVIDLLDEHVQITEIINIENESDLIIDTKNSAFVKNIPENTTDFYFLKKNAEFDIVEESGKLIFMLLLPGGKHQLYYSYNLPITRNPLLFETSILPTTSEVELIIPDNGLEVEFRLEDMNLERGIIRKDQYFGNRLYHSQLLPVSSDLKNLKIQISGIPIAPKKLIYPAVLLALMLLIGIFWFLILRHRPGLQN